MKQKRFSAEQIVAVLREAAAGTDVRAVRALPNLGDHLLPMAPKVRRLAGE
jgi:hypothetical protein